MTIHTTYAAALQHGKVEPGEDDLVVGVVRHPAPWFLDSVDRNVEALGPPEKLLSAFKKVEEAADAATAWESVSYESRYLAHLQEDASARHAADHLLERSQDRDVWLVCYEADERYCHRRLLRQHLTGDDGTVHAGDLDDACAAGSQDCLGRSRVVL
ncbi:DUF488 domain-containing protein [Halobacteriaceae archaeon GCM10025711]